MTQRRISGATSLWLPGAYRNFKVINKTLHVFDGMKSSALDPSTHSLMSAPVLRACPPCQEN